MDLAQEVWQIDMLGGLRAHHGESVIERFQTQKTGALLAYLAFYPQRRRLREELIDLLWPDAESEAGRHRLSQALAWLRSQMEPSGVPKNSVLLADRQSVGIQPGAVVTDVAQFEAALAAVQKNLASEEAKQALEQALSLYKGELLPGSYEDWVLAERTRLQDAFIAASRLLIRWHEQAHRYSQALAHARRALESDPLAEELYGDLMRVLAADGQQAAALRHAKELERLLERELGETPTAATRALIEQIRRSDPPPAKAWPAAPGGEQTLPTPLTRFFGREAEIAQAQSLLSDERVRLLTLTGVGGGGKTRLAIEIARSLAGGYAGAVWFVPLADLSDAHPMPDAIADALRLPRSAAVPAMEQIVEALTPRRVLLVLDNLEHLVDEGAPVIKDLLARLPALTLLVTSRRRLGLDGEREIPIPPLRTPVVLVEPNLPDQLMMLDSVRLFVDRAQAVRPAFGITPQNATAVAGLCARLEGIPLAIELCAAWAQTLTPAQMLDQLTKRFDLLVSRRADIPSRHRTMRAALDYSYGQLPPGLQQSFSRLSIFRGGWTLEAAVAVCGEKNSGLTPIATLAALTELRERSLLLAEETGTDTAEPEMRYRMLETLREFAAERLAPEEMHHRRRAHAEFFLHLAETAEAQLSSHDQSVWLARLEADHDNLRTALTWALEEKAVETGLRLAGALAIFWDMRGYLGEGQGWLERLLALPRPSHTLPYLAAVRAKALNARGFLARNQGHSAEVDRAMQEALALWQSLGDERGIATTLQTMATLAYSHEDCDEARALLGRGLSLARKLGDQSLVARALLNLGNIALEQGEWDEAWAKYAESLSLYQQLGIRNRTAYALNNMGLVARYKGDFETARTLLQDSLTVSREAHDRTGIAEALLNLGTLHRLESHCDAARLSLQEAAAVAAESGEKRLLVWCVKEAGHIAAAEQSWTQAARLLTAAERLRAAMGISFKPAGPAEIARDLGKAQAGLGETGFAAARAAGTGLSLAQALTEALQPPTEIPTPPLAHSR